MVHRGAIRVSCGPKYGGEQALRKSVFTATLKCEVKGKKEDEGNERRILQGS